MFVPPGHTEPLLFAAGGNPYGTSFPSGETPDVSLEALEAARYQGRRLAHFANVLKSA